MPEILAEVEESIDITAHVAATPGSLTDDYNDLQNHPSINGVELVGNKTTADLNIEPLPGSITPEMFAPDTQDEMVVGLAQNLLARTGTTNTTPYLFRKSPNNVSAELHRLTGCTVAWQQMFDDTKIITSTTVNGMTFSVSNHKITATGTPTSTYANMVSNANSATLQENHVYLLVGSISSGTLRLDGFTSSWGNTQLNLRANSIVKNTYSATHGLLRCMDMVTGTQVTITITGVGLFDLTQMFGSTMADAILAMETATAGSGVAFFRSLFPSAYYAYTAPTLKSVQTSARVARGFNQWDEEWVNGYYDATTGNLVQSASATTLACRNHIPVIPGGTYYLNVNHVGTGTLYYALFEYGADGTFLKRTDIPATFTVSTGTTSIAFHIANYGNGYYGHDICLNISGSRNGQYEPYEAKTYPLDSDLTLRGIPKLTNGVLSYDGDIYLPTGEVTRKYAEVDLGSFTWGTNQTGTNAFEAYTTGISPTKANGVDNFVCAKLPKATSFTDVADYSIRGFSANGGVAVKVPKTVASTGAGVKQWLTDNNVKLVYPLATPTTESADPYTEVQLAGTTEQFVTENYIPVGNEAFYAEDLTGVVQNLAPLPTTAGTYKLQVTVSGGVPSYSWVSG